MSSIQSREFEPILARALAACALREAKWWHMQVALTAMHSETIDPAMRDECRERVEGLERAAEGQS